MARARCMHALAFAPDFAADRIPASQSIWSSAKPLTSTFTSSGSSGATATRNLPYFDNILERQPFLAVDSFSLPDITLYAFLLFTDILSFPVSSGLKGLAAWRARVEALPAVTNRSGKDILPEDLARFTG